jgi:UDP-N-acetylglucosamine 2-epimerase
MRTYLQREGVSPAKIDDVGNVMIDSLIRFLPFAERHQVDGLPERFALVTLHRPSNVDDDRVLRGILKSLLEISKSLPLVFPVHPRTRRAIAGLDLDASALHLLEPLPNVGFSSVGKKGCCGHYGFWRDSGRDYLFTDTLYYIARKHGAASDCQSGN